MRAVGDPSLEWSAEVHLLALIADLLAGANWQRGGGKGPQPKPIGRPGTKTPDDRRRIGTPVPRERMRELLDQWTRGGE